MNFYWVCTVTEKEISRVVVCSRYLGKYKIVCVIPVTESIVMRLHIKALVLVSRQIKLDVKNTGAEIYK